MYMENYSERSNLGTDVAVKIAFISGEGRRGPWVLTAISDRGI